MTYDHEVTELTLFAISSGELYEARTKPIIGNLARFVVRGDYSEPLALKAWGHWAEAAARRYASEHANPADWAKLFPPTVRRQAAVVALSHYAEQVASAAAKLKAEQENKAQWPLSAIREANTNGGQFFFSRDTMRFFRDTMASFGVDYDGEKIFIVRCKRGRDLDGRPMGTLGERREFNPSNGHIGLPIR